ncbi:hypothetical protein JDV02_006650 [Purpureocillium takamizusanense]|uniref:Uncharacterized protein n=1 Tax=Purpureocillium takamizusanense TaxID=2060973 RepID=A0A9Q8QJZ8_9HYPO|nr:uncharacterized protein JDV02_006650 [Purpureocillium takamizusanense]UNI20576.1 hypothetical protein JDV02_006650 [Purpureocillium takamizusanense]
MPIDAVRAASAFSPVLRFALGSVSSGDHDSLPCISSNTALFPLRKPNGRRPEKKNLTEAAIPVGTDGRATTSRPRRATYVPPPSCWRCARFVRVSAPKNVVQQLLQVEPAADVSHRNHRFPYPPAREALPPTFLTPSNDLRQQRD